MIFNFNIFLLFILLINIHASELKKINEKSRVFLWNKTTGRFTNSNGQTRSEIYKEFQVLYKYFPLENSTVQLIVDNMEPYIKFDQTTLSITGFLGDMWKMLQEMLKFRTRIINVEYITGLKMIENNISDVFLAAVVYKKSIKNSYFSQPYFKTWYHLYYKLPEGRPPTYVHFSVFHPILWVFIILLFLFLSLVLWLTCRIIHRTFKKAEVTKSFVTFFVGIIAAFLNTGYDLKLRSLSARMQMFLAMVFGTLCYYALSASLVAKLAVLDRTVPFRNVWEIADRDTQYVLCLRNNSFVFNNFTDDNQEILPQWKTNLNTNKCPDITKWENIISVICKDSIVILENRIVLSMVLNEPLPCQVSYLPQRYFPSENYILMNKRFKGIKAINKSMSKLRSSGLMQKMEDKWIKKHVENINNINNVNQITFHHVKGLMFIYILMILGSVCVLLVEIYYYNLFNSGNNTRKYKKKKRINSTFVVKYLKYSKSWID